MEKRPSGTDQELLDVLSKAFAHHAGPDATIHVEQLQKALGLRSTYLARRIFSAFDKNKNGAIDRDEFLTGVRELVLGDDREKLRFAFRLWDGDDDGHLNREELHRMISLSLAEADVAERGSQPPEQLVNVLLQRADIDRDGRISFDELEKIVRQHPHLLTRMTRSEAIWIAPNEELLLLLDERAGRKRSPSTLQLAGGLWSRGQQIAFLVLWVLANVAALSWSMIWGRTSVTTDPAMQIGRAIGACIDLNAAFVFLPVMRRMLTKLRPTWIGKLVPVDDAIEFHKIVGHTLFVLAIVHSAAMLLAYAGGHSSVPALEILRTSRGLTGAVLLGLFAIMWFFALGFIRRSKRFELFYFTHLLFFAWLGLVVAHAPRVLVFAGVAIGAFIFETLLRARRRGRATKIVSTWPLRSGVCRLELERPQGFVFQAGDYIFLRIPTVARHEWHPFTISSAPELSTLSIHVRSLGNWTSTLRRVVEARSDGRTSNVALPAFIDGPFGSPSAHIFSRRNVVLIGAGIGVTPFASVLESAVLRGNKLEDAAPCALEKVHFFWLNRDAYSFEWFRGLLSRIEQRDSRGLLDIHLCMTGAKSGVTAFGLELARDVMHAAGRSDIITGLRTRTHLGHPDWDVELTKIAAWHKPNPVEVFYCGPPALAKKIEPICQRLGMRFHEERF